MVISPPRPRLEKSMNGDDKMEVEQAREAIEVNGSASANGESQQQQPGFLQKAVNRIWRRGSYESVAGEQANGTAASDNACVIS